MNSRVLLEDPGVEQLVVDREPIRITWRRGLVDILISVNRLKWWDGGGAVIDRAGAVEAFHLDDGAFEFDTVLGVKVQNQQFYVLTPMGVQIYPGDLALRPAPRFLTPPQWQCSRRLSGWGIFL